MSTYDKRRTAIGCKCTSATNVTFEWLNEFYNFRSDGLHQTYIHTRKWSAIGRKYQRMHKRRTHANFASWSSSKRKKFIGCKRIKRKRIGFHKRWKTWGNQGDGGGWTVRRNFSVPNAWKARELDINDPRCLIMWILVSVFHQTRLIFPISFITCNPSAFYVLLQL